MQKKAEERYNTDQMHEARMKQTEADFRLEAMKLGFILEPGTMGLPGHVHSVLRRGSLGSGFATSRLGFNAQGSAAAIPRQGLLAAPTNGRPPRYYVLQQ